MMLSTIITTLFLNALCLFFIPTRYKITIKIISIMGPLFCLILSSIVLGNFD